MLPLVLEAFNHTRMARKWSNINIPGALHFVTGNVRDRIPIFRQELCAQEFFTVLSDLKTEWPAKVVAYVLMPEHFHFIVNPRDGEIKAFVQALKSKLALKIVDLAGHRFLLNEPRPDGPIHQVW